MQEIPFSVGRILDHGSTVHGTTTVSTYATDGAPETTTFADIGARAAGLSHALRDLAGVGPGDPVATVMANSAEHLEVMFAAAAMGAVFHPVNHNLSAGHVVDVLTDARDRVVVCDATLLDSVVPLLPRCPAVRTLIVVGRDTDGPGPSTLPGADGPVTVHDYETVLDGRPTRATWPTLPETAPAALCHSTASGGTPTAVVMSHRSLWLHSLGLRTADSFAVRTGCTFLCLVPVFHVLSWGVPLAAFMSGTPLVLTGRRTDPAHVARVIGEAMPRAAHGPPSVWLDLYVHYLHRPPTRMSLREVFSGGAAVPGSLIDAWETRYGVDLVHAWGMTETGPVGTVARPPTGVSGEARRMYRHSQGRFPVELEHRVVDDTGTVMAAHDRNVGEIQVRGNTVSAQGAAATPDGWLRTGDIGSVTRNGYLTVHDRAADVIRSGGEWIYSTTLENIIADSPDVLEAVVVGVPDEKWGQRPLAVVVPAPAEPGTGPDAGETGAGADAGATTEAGPNAGQDPADPTHPTPPGRPVPRDRAARALRDRVAAQVPPWMVPERWAFVDRIARTSVEKADKAEVRARLARGEYDVVTLDDTGAATGGTAPGTDDPVRST